MHDHTPKGRSREQLWQSIPLIISQDSDYMCKHTKDTNHTLCGKMTLQNTDMNISMSSFYIMKPK